MNRPAGFATAVPSPDTDVEAALWHAFKIGGSTVAREQLFTLHAPFARALARRQLRERSFGDVDIADLRQLAYEGLLTALDRYDPDRKVPFRAFANRRIKGNIVDGMVRVNELREQMAWRHRLRRERTQSLASKAAASAATTADAMAALAELAVGLALGFMLEGTGMMASAEEGHQSFGTAYDSTAWKEMNNRLTAELADLPQREQFILRHHYMDDVSFEHLANLLGLSKARVSQLHRSALETLRKRMFIRGHLQVER